MDSRNSFWENFILIAIVLVIIQTFLDDFSRYMHWSVSVRNALMVSGFIFDLIFSIEFTVRSIISRRKRGFNYYWNYERGWVDFLSSYPLLFLNSGPSLYLLLSGGLHEQGAAIGILNILKMVKAIRVTRILRLIRIIKILGRIQNADSRMAQYHTSSISTIAVFTTISVVFFANIIFSHSIDKASVQRATHYTTLVQQACTLPFYDQTNSDTYLKPLFEKDTQVLKVSVAGRTVVENITSDRFKRYYSYEDYIKVESGTITILVSIEDINQEVAQTHLVIFFIIVFMVLSFMFIYTRMFVQNITDVVHVLNLGFWKRDYSLQVKVNQNLDDHEVFKLARFYNDHYLPAKLKKTQEEQQEKSSLSMDDLMNFDK